MRPYGTRFHTFLLWLQTRCPHGTYNQNLLEEKHCHMSRRDIRSVTSNIGRFHTSRRDVW
jgi:hypothetical protein